MKEDKEKDKREFRPTELVQYMNSIFGSKDTGRPFTQMDINTYIVRGYIPIRYGGFKLVKLNKYNFKGCMVRLEDAGELEKFRK